MRTPIRSAREQCLVLDQQLQGFAEADLQPFLNHVYLNRVYLSHLYLKSCSNFTSRSRHVADLFDARKLMTKAITCVKRVLAACMFATTADLLRWLLPAEQFIFEEMRQSCSSAIQGCLQSSQVAAAQPLSHSGSFTSSALQQLHAILHGVDLLTELFP